MLAALSLLACGGAEPTTRDDEEEPAMSDEGSAAEDAPEAAAEPAERSPRLVLDHPTIPAMTGPSAAEEARLDATLYVRGAPGTTLTMVVPLAHELQWTLTARDGTTWEPVFLPPPMPRPGGPPTTTVTIPEGG